MYENPLLYAELTRRVAGLRSEWGARELDLVVL